MFMTRNQEIIAKRILKSFPTAWDLPRTHYMTQGKIMLCQSQKRVYLLALYEMSKADCADAIFDAVYCNAVRQRKFFEDVEIALTAAYNLSFATLWSILTRNVVE